MKKNSLMTLLGIALVVAIISTGIFYGLFVNKLSSNTGSGKSLAVAAKSLKAGAVLTASDVKLIAWPAEQLPKGTFGSVEQVTGKTLFDSINEDELFLDSRLISADGSGGAGIPAGMRAVSVHVSDSSGVMELLRTGYKVDVQVFRRQGPGMTEVRTALQNLQVLSVTLKPSPNSQGFDLPVVTLLAKPQQADVLAAADAGARVRLSLRNPLDDEAKSRTSLNLDTVMRSTQ